MISIAILGFGVVGSGAAEVLTQNKDLLEKKLGDRFRIKAILDLREFPGSPFEPVIVHDFNQILNDPDISVVAEMMGGSHPAYDFSKACLEAGKSVVTSNKEVVANFGVELTRIARQHHVSYLFEASVGGGIPVIRPMQTDLAANHIGAVSGILNGTTNYILTRMKQDNASYDDALAEAQKLGYAERNPAADVEGLDAARKIVILSALAFGKMIQPDQIHVEGITHITTADMEMAAELGCSVKLIGYSTCQDGKVLAMVSPRLVPLSAPIAAVEDVFNAIMVDTDMLGTAMFYGRGAGKLPTASAIVADILDCMRHPEGLPVPDWDNAGTDDLLPFGQYKCRNCFVLAGTAHDLKSISEVIDVDQIVTGKDYVAVTTGVLSEEEADAIPAKIGLPLIKRIRILG